MMRVLRVQRAACMGASHEVSRAGGEGEPLLIASPLVNANEQMQRALASWLSVEITYLRDKNVPQYETRPTLLLQQLPAPA